MLNKTKKVAFLTTGLAGALVVSSAVGIALSSCTTTDTSSSNKPNKYTYSIDWTDQAQLKQLTIDEQGLVYSSADKTEIITVAPNTAATSFVIPASVKYITGYNLITRNSSGAVATSVSRGAFQDQTSLISITFASNDTLISIGDSSFKGCTYLSSITLPTSTTVVYNSAFESCTNLRDIGLTNVSYIGTAAFKNAIANGADVSINLSATTYIGDEAFNGSTSLANVDLSSNTTLTYIGKSAFKNALASGSSATTIDLSKAAVLKTISDAAFQNATNLGTVVLPTTSVLTTIGANAFSGATSLTQVGSTANAFTAPSSLANYVLTSVTGDTAYVSSGIGANAFNGTKITTVDLSAITVVTPLGDAAFKGMTSLASVNFGSSSKITTIPYSLFEGDIALTTLTLPASITTIRDGNYNDNSAADTTYANQKSPFYNSGLVTIDMSNITSYGTGNLTLTGSITTSAATLVPYALFQRLTNLETVYLKTGTVGINTKAFDGATALKTVKEGNSITNTTNGDGFSISETLEWTGYYAFRNSGIKNVSFANATAENATNKLWYLGQGTFEGATALTTVDLTKADTTTSHTIPANDVGTGSDAETGSGLFAISSSLFKNASALTSVQLPNSVTKIFTEAFVGNNELNSVNFNQLLSLNTIQTDNFNNTKLVDIDFSNITNATTISTLSNSFTGNVSVFNNLQQSNATVKLPAAMTLESGLSNTVFTLANSTASNVIHSSIDYPKGLTVIIGRNTGATGPISIGAGSSGASEATAKNRMLQYVSDDFNLATSTNGQGIQEYYPRTFFGNTKLKKLTLSATNLYTGGSSNPTQQTTLFVHNNSNNTTNFYNPNIVPFGRNSSLTDLVFTGFALVDNPDWPATDSKTNDTSNSLFRTNAITWAQVSTIINKFAANETNTPTVWTPGSSSNPHDTSKINQDSIVTGTPNKNDKSYSLTFTNSKGTADSDTTWGNVTKSITGSIANDTTNSSIKFIHNGVTWTLNVTSGGAITLVGTNINVYKVTRPGGTANLFQICFNEGTGEATTPSKITVTLEIYTPSTTTK